MNYDEMNQGAVAVISGDQEQLIPQFSVLAILFLLKKWENISKIYLSWA